MSSLSHFDAQGQAHMVDVGAKAATRRVAVAGGRIEMQAATLAIIESGTAKKGDVLGIARIAGIQAAKKTSELIPLCHPLALTRVAIEFLVEKPGASGRPAVACTATAGRPDAPGFSTRNSMATRVSAKGWHNGMSSLVFLAA